MPSKRVSRANTIRWLRNPLYSERFKLRDEFREGFAILHDFERKLKIQISFKIVEDRETLFKFIA